MSANKKLIRENFRNSVFKRDHNKCKMCNASGVELDAHHITDRSEMPNGGYVKENGISLCHDCHEKAELFHLTGEALEEWHPDDLYEIIGSSKEKAIKASEKLNA